MRARWAAYGSAVTAIHIAGILLLVMGLSHHPTLLGSAFLAYTFGLRHAFDVDHIAAIDNTVRKLLQQRKPASGVGFFFSLGHSTVVLGMVLALVLAARMVTQHLPILQHTGSIVGAAVSGTFLLAIGTMNLAVLFDLWSMLRTMRHTPISSAAVDNVLNTRGVFSRWLSPLLAVIKSSWQIYPIGVLFGLGFDTASEVALLAMSVLAAHHAVPLSGVLALPVLFAAGMSAMDTLDGMFMSTAYRWAFSTALRKVFYNLSMTGLSVLAALMIGSIELVQVISPPLGLRHGVWRWIDRLNFGSMGLVLVALFVIVWAISIGYWKLFRVESRWADSLPTK